MSWSGLASNQMVTFTNAQTSPFTLNAGQFPVTSNECMTKSQALTKYNLDASAMSAYANNQLVPKSVWVSATTYYLVTNNAVNLETSTNICSTTVTGGFAIYTLNSNGVLQVGDTIYVLIEGTYYPLGSDFFYLVYLEGTNKLWVEFDGNGVIISKTYCQSITYTQIFGWYSSPCGVQATIYEGSNFLYYSDTSGTLFNGTVYIFIGPNDVGSFDWSEQPITDGVLGDNTIVQSACQP